MPLQSIRFKRLSYVLNSMPEMPSTSEHHGHVVVTTGDQGFIVPL